MRVLSTVLYLFAAAAGLGLLFCIVGLLASIAGQTELATAILKFLAPALFVVALPAVLAGAQLAQHSPANNYWKAALHGCPSWLRYMIWATWGVAGLVFLWVFVSGSNNQSPSLPLGPAFGVIPVFYATSLGILISAARQGLNARQCANGHAMGPEVAFCSKCGAAAR